MFFIIIIYYLARIRVNIILKNITDNNIRRKVKKKKKCKKTTLLIGLKFRFKLNICLKPKLSHFSIYPFNHINIKYQLLK